MADAFLTQAEVESLIEGMSNDPLDQVAAPEPVDPVRPYQLSSQERIVRGRMPTLEVVNERFASNLRIGLFNFIRRSPEISIKPVLIQRYSEFLNERETPTNFNIVALRPLRGSGLVVCSSALIFTVIDLLYGGNGKFQVRMDGRDFSATEQRVISRLMAVILDEYKKAWKGIYPLDLEYQRSEMRSQFVNVATPSEMVICSQLQLLFGQVQGTIDFCLPYSTLEPIRDILYSTTQGDSFEEDRRWAGVLTHEIQEAEVTLVAQLAQTQATVEELLSLKSGDFIELERESSIELSVQGIPIFECNYGTHNAKYAVHIQNNLRLSPTGEHHG